MSLRKLPAQLRLYREMRKVQREGDPEAVAFGQEGLLAAVVLNLATAFTSMYATRLGANAAQIGMIGSAPQMMAMLLLIPGSIFLGRFASSRRPVEMTALLTGACYGLGAIAPFLVGQSAVYFLILAIALANAALNLYNSVWQNYFSKAIPVSRRNELYSARTSGTFVAATLVILLTGIVLGSAADDLVRIRLYQASYFLSFLVSIFQWRAIRQLPEAESSGAGRNFKMLLVSAKRLLADRRFLRFSAVILLFHAGWYMAWPLFFLAQVRYCGCDEAWLGYMSVSASLLQFLTTRHWSRYIRRRGISRGLLAGMSGLLINPFCLILAMSLPVSIRLPGLLLLNLITSISFSSFQLSFLQCLLKEIPQEGINLNLALFNTLLLAVNAVMQMSGVLLYNALGGDRRAIILALSAAGLLRILGTLAFALFASKRAAGDVPEPAP